MRYRIGVKGGVNSVFGKEKKSLNVTELKEVLNDRIFVLVFLSKKKCCKCGHAYNLHYHSDLTFDKIKQGLITLTSDDEIIK